MLILWLGCLGPKLAERKPVPMVRYLPEEPKTEMQRKVVRSIANAQWDRGLEKACSGLVMQLRDRKARIPSAAVKNATAREGFPGQARFSKLLNGGGFPDALLAQVRKDIALDPVDVALCSKQYGDGGVLWILGWAPHLIEIDPIPLRLPLDGSFPIRIEAKKVKNSVLFVAPPDSDVQRKVLLPEAHRWISDLHIPGEYRFEVVVDGVRGAQVAALFSVFVDQSPPNIPPMVSSPLETPHPIEAEKMLYRSVNALRKQRGLRQLSRFSTFEPLAREHSAWMAAAGVVAHSLPGTTNGVAKQAGQRYHPRARHYENVAAAYSAAEALEMVINSPGHLKALLCDTCTHMSIGAAIEPTLKTQPRLFVTWELLAFPQGVPKKIERFNKDETTP